MGISPLPSPLPSSPLFSSYRLSFTFPLLITVNYSLFLSISHSPHTPQISKLAETPTLSFIKKHDMRLTLLEKAMSAHGQIELLEVKKSSLPSVLDVLAIFLPFSSSAILSSPFPPLPPFPPFPLLPFLPSSLLPFSLPIPYPQNLLRAFDSERAYCEAVKGVDVVTQVLIELMRKLHPVSLFSLYAVSSSPFRFFFFE